VAGRLQGCVPTAAAFQALAESTAIWCCCSISSCTLARRSLASSMCCCRPQAALGSQNSSQIRVMAKVMAMHGEGLVSCSKQGRGPALCS
jgi:hypothetical protein